MMMKRRLKVTVTTVRRTMTLARRSTARGICPLCREGIEKPPDDNSGVLLQIDDRKSDDCDPRMTLIDRSV